MNPPEITIGSKWRHNASWKIATVLAITGEDVIYTGPFANGWAWMKERAFREWFSPYVWTLDEAMAEAGHVLGPGQQWHKPEEFVEEDLPPVTDGGLPWRPAIKNEPLGPGDEYWEFGCGPWAAYKKATVIITGENSKHRTRRPLPSTEEWIPLGSEDVPPLSVIRKIGEIENWHWRLVSYVTGVQMVCADRGYPWREVMETHEILRPGQTEWQPCKKLKEVSL